MVRRKIEENFWASFMDIGYFESLFGAIMGLMWFERDCSLNKYCTRGISTWMIEVKSLKLYKCVAASTLHMK